MAAANAWSKVVNPGDHLRIECHWDNSAAHQPTVGGTKLELSNVMFGENTTDEMCVGGFLVSQ